MNHISLRNGMSWSYTMSPTVQDTFEAIPASLGVVHGGEYNQFCNISPPPLLSPVRFCDLPCTDGFCVDGQCMPCQAGYFGVNCTGESHVIKFTANHICSQSTAAVSSTDKQDTVMLKTPCVCYGDQWTPSTCLL